MIAQKMMTAPQVLGERHREGADRVAEEAEHVGPLAADEVADLAADEDEGGRDEGLEGDRRLDAADGRLQVADDRRDRHVHERGVDDEDEHRHGEEEGDARARRACLGRRGGRRGSRHRVDIQGRCRGRWIGASIA